MIYGCDDAQHCAALPSYYMMSSLAADPGKRIAYNENLRNNICYCPCLMPGRFYSVAWASGAITRLPTNEATQIANCDLSSTS